MRARVLLALAAALVATSALAQSPDIKSSASDPPSELLGSWRLNVAKSKYSPGPPLRAETRVYSRSRDGVTGVVTRTYADGQMEKYEYVANFGGEYMVTGTPAYDAVKLRRIDDLASEAVLSHAGMVYGIARRVISRDGKTMTITFDRKDPDQPVHNVAIYDKVAN